ncbi:MAG: hypothetical protein ABI884_02535 [Gemmatimonadota bacterium]
MSIYEGYIHFRNPERITSPVLSLGVLALSALFEGASLSIGYRAFKRTTRRYPDGDSVKLWQFIKLSKDPNLYESLLEDSAGVLLILTLVAIARATQSLIAGESVVPALLGPRSILVTLTVERGGRTSESQLENSLAQLTEKLKAVDERISYVYFDFGSDDGDHSSA